MSPTADIRARSRRGMTLAELLVAIAIFTVVMSSVFVMFSAITNSVRRSYSTMDVFERSRGALITIENDIQAAFAAPATGDDVFFYGEPYGFTFVGVDHDGRLGRLTYAVHRDATRLTDPNDPLARGVRVTLARRYGEMLDRYNHHARNAPEGAEPFSYYYSAPSLDTLMDFEVEIIYGLLVRIYERGVDNVKVFPELEELKNQLPRAFQPPGETRTFTPFMTDALGVTQDPPPEYIRSRLLALEDCHYWIQLIHGPGLAPVRPWNPMSIWHPDATEGLFWFDHVADGVPVDDRRALWDHVIGQEIVLATYLLDPDTGARIEWQDPRLGAIIAVPAIDLPPVFTYYVESGAHSATFNTLFNLDSKSENNFELLARSLAGMDPDITDIPKLVRDLIRTKQFYEVGHPLQARLPASFEVVFQVVNPPVTPGAPTELYQFKQRIHIPTGFLRRGRAI